MSHRIEVKSLLNFRKPLFVLASLFAVMTVSATDPGYKYEQSQFRSATIYEQNQGQKPLVKMRRVVGRVGKEIKVTREFIDSAVKLRKRVTYQGDDWVFCDMEYIQSGEEGSARVVRENGRVEVLFDYTGPAGDHKSGREKFDPNTINNDMVGPFLLSHWKELMDGSRVKCRYLALTRAETIGFEFVKQRETSINGKPFIVVKMSPSSSFISAFVDPLIFAFEKNGDHRCLKYEGRTQVKVKDGDKYKDLDGITVFDW